MPKALVVDDDPSLAPTLAEYLSQEGYDVDIAGNVAEGKRRLTKTQPAILLVDLLLPDGNGLELAEMVADQDDTRVIVITGHPSVETAVGAVRHQVDDYLVKPFDGKTLRECLQRHVPDQLASDDEEEDERGEVEPALLNLVGESEGMQKVYRQIRQVAPTDSTVFIQGESGVGKELVAAAIHELSGRDGNYVPVNCGAVPQDLMASELFGHDAGSFTGAQRQHKGFFERANAGTLFLDEITEMPMELQVHFLRILETSTVTRVGGEKEYEFDVRIITATNRDPKEAIEEGKLREDLYFRLMVFPIAIPPLRERDDDAALLARFFIDRINKRRGLDKSLTDEVLEQINRHTWPGNVRELKHVLERAYIMTDDDGEISELPQYFDNAPRYKTGGLQIGESIDGMEKRLVLATLEHYEGDKKQAAETLGVSVSTLRNRLKKYGKE